MATISATSLSQTASTFLVAGQEVSEDLVADFSALFKKYAPDVLRFAFYLSGNRQEAEDITSETFVRAWTSSDRIRSATVKAYLFTIARNLFLQELRKKSRCTDLDEELNDRAPGPHEQAQGRQELHAVLAELQKLPEVDRAALLMRALEGIPYEEIASVLEIPVTTAKVKVHRARLLLARIR